MRRLARIVLAPALRVARAVLDDAELTMPRPDGPPRGHVPGVESARVLIVGDGIALGTGVRTHDLALPGALARAVGARSGCGIDVDLIAEPHLPLDRAVVAVRDGHPLRYDAVVVIAGSNEALQLLSPSEWGRQLAVSLAEIRRVLAPGTGLVLAGIPANFLARNLPRTIARLADDHAAQLDRVSAEFCARTGMARFVALEAADRSSIHSAEAYARWGGALADEVAAALRGHGLPATESDRGDEERRQAAVDRLGLAESETDPRLRRIVEMARRIFATETALFTVLDRDVQLHKARSGTEVRQIPRSDSFCQYTILDSGGMIVEDARLDERFRDSPLVTGDPHVRFYAGFPVDSPDGERVGALCIYDSNPRRVEDVDLALLRELSHLVQTELWRYLPVTATRSEGLRRLARSWTFPSLAPIRRAWEAKSDGA